MTLITYQIYAGRLGDLTWPVVRDHIDEVVTVSEEEIVAAMRICYERMKVRDGPR